MMSISAIQNSGVYQAPEVQTDRPAPSAPPAQAAGRIVPEDRAFDRYDPEDKSEITVCDTDKVDQELENLRKEQDRLEEQLRTAPPEQAEALQRQLDQVNRELSRKDSGAYRRQHAVFS